MRKVSFGEEGGSGDASSFYLSPAVPAEKMLSNMRASLERGLPEARLCKPHGHVMSIAAGGPSLADTYKDLTGFVCAVNGSLRWLIDHQMNPAASYACGIMDAGEHIADAIVAHPGVRYYVASHVDPAVFDKLKGCDVRLWHVTPNSMEDPDGAMAILDAHYKQNWHAIGGGCTMGLRWVDLGYYLGFRKFHLHGMDSSFRDGSTHAYPDKADTKERIEFAGRSTRLNFLAQVYDFSELLERLWDQDRSIEMEVYGDGLLQDEWKSFRDANPDAYRGNVVNYKSQDGYLFPATCNHTGALLSHSAALFRRIVSMTDKRGVAVQAGGNVGILANLLAGVFRRVITLEPDPTNWECLDQNVKSPNVTKINSALGREEGTVAIERERGNCGASYIDGVGIIPMTTIDAMGLNSCDLIVLDVEGYELQALQGAKDTIDKFRPVIVVEDKGHGLRYGVREGMIETWLRENFGYSVKWSDGSDFVLTC